MAPARDQQTVLGPDRLQSWQQVGGLRRTTAATGLPQLYPTRTTAPRPSDWAGPDWVGGARMASAGPSLGDVTYGGGTPACGAEPRKGRSLTRLLAPPLERRRPGRPEVLQSPPASRLSSVPLLSSVRKVVSRK